MIRIIVAVLAVLTVQARAEWSLDELNRIVEQTNFRVGTGCSGTLISVDRKLVLTNEHCIRGEIRIVEIDEVQGDGTVKRVKRQIRLPTTVAQSVYDDHGGVNGQRESRVEIVRLDPYADLALLRILGPMNNRIAASILPTGGRVQRGEPIYIVGNPAGQEGSVVRGNVSSIRREMSEFTSPLGRPWEGMQISGGIWGGNSGGAVFNSSGFLIGVPAVGHRIATFIGFAVPIDAIHRFLGAACQADLFGGINPDHCKK